MVTKSARRWAWASAAAMAIAASAAGCEKCGGGGAGPLPDAARPAPSTSEAGAPPPEAGAKGDGEGKGGGDPNSDKLHGVRKFHGIDVPVYVDGKQVAALRWGEVPPIPLVPHSEDPLKNPLYYRLYDYVVALGLQPKSIKAVHMRDFRLSIASVEANELVQRKDILVIGFMGGKTGIARMMWPIDGLKNEHRIDEIAAMQIYVNKPVPPFKEGMTCYWKNDKCSAEMPYVEGEMAKGTRVYVDGPMIGYVKRRALGDATIVGRTGDGEYKYSLAKMMGGLGDDAADAKFVELIAGDNVIARLDAATWKAKQGELVFTLPKHGHGKIKLTIPVAAQAPTDAGALKDEALTITAVRVYKKTTPTKRELTPIGDVDPASFDESGLEDEE
ncbi:MAG: hypothetical protein JNL38_31480 [Myxococcales bacterium]|nr:hypothetical protein [Myxococcales bacterium]